MDYTNEHCTYVGKLYKICNGRVPEAVKKFQEHFNFTPDSKYIRKVWTGEGYITQGQHGGKRKGIKDNRGITDEEFDLIRKRLPLYGTVSRTSRALERGPDTVNKALKKRNLRWNEKTQTLETIVDQE